jgi:uncharacterized protein YndB with AHSA1/START domain
MRRLKQSRPHGGNGVIRVEERRRFGVPVERGFDYVTDTANWPAYWPDFEGVEVGEEWPSVGARAVVRLRLLGRSTELELTMRRFERPRLVEYESRQKGLPDARHERRFEPDGDGFDYAIVVEYEPRGGLAGRLLDNMVVRRAVERAARRTLDNLERELSAA